jgi:ankyrin repeat protein
VPALSFPMDPDLGQLRKKARELQHAVRAGDPAAVALAAEFNPDGPASTHYPLSAAQLVLARRYGFASWPRLHHYIDIVTGHGWLPAPPATGDNARDSFLRLSCGGYAVREPDERARDLHDARDLLASHPDLPASSIAVAAACADVAALQQHLAADPGAATRPGGPYDWTPLMYLAHARHDPSPGLDTTLAAARLLLAAGADPSDGTFSRGRPAPVTPLSGALYAARYDAADEQAGQARALAFARLLLEAGADPDDGSAADLALDDGDELLELLLGFGLGQDRNGPWRQLLGGQLPAPAVVLRILLFHAIERGSRHRVLMLARHGVDLAGPFTELGTDVPHRWPIGTPLGVALVAGHRELAAELASLGAPPLDPASADAFVAAVLAGDSAAARAASAPAAAVRARWPGLPAWAASRGVPESMPLLVAAGFDVNALGRSDGPYDQPWQSALHVAAETGNLPLAQQLLTLGADPDLQDAITHQTPLSWARDSGHQALIDVLEPVTAA